MFSVAVDFSTLFNSNGSIHPALVVFGVVVYLSYSFWSTIRLLLQPVLEAVSMMMQPKAEDPSGQCAPSDQASDAEPGQEWRRQITARRAAGGVAVVALCIGLALSAQTAIVEQGTDASCPLEAWEMDSPYVQPELSEAAQAVPAAPAAPVTGSERWIGGAEAEEEPTDEAAKLRVKLRSPGAWKFMKRGAPSALAASPTILLARAQAAADPSTAWPTLEACVSWAQPAGEGSAPGPELYAQLECNVQLVESGATTQEAAPALLVRARDLMGALRAHGEEAGSILQAAQVKWARLTHGVFQLSCKGVADELQVARRTKGPAKQGQRPPAAVSLTALRSLKRLEAPFRETLAALAAGLQAEGCTSEELEDLRSSLGADRACALQALQEGRSVALALPRGAPLVRRAMQCRPKMLEDFQALVLAEAAEATDAATIFALGLYYSDVGLAMEQGHVRAPLFEAGAQALTSWTSSSETSWAADAGGSHAPTDLVQAEALLLAGENASIGADASDRGATRALRLYQHAKMLALKHHDGAAEWRYRAAAELAATHRRQKLASHALGRLGYFLSLRGRKEEALVVAGEALQHGEEDPLSQYLQASLGRSLGELQTTEQVLDAEKKLGQVAGKLPSKTLEEQRATAHAELGWWRLVATDGLQVCLRAWDVAQMLICALSGLVFQLPGIAPPAESP